MKCMQKYMKQVIDTNYNLYYNTIIQLTFREVIMFNKFMTVLAYAIAVLSAVMVAVTWGDSGSTIAWLVAFIAWFQVATMKKV